MNTGKNYKKIVHGSGISRIYAQLSTLKSWLIHPEMKKSHLKAKRSRLIQYADFLLSILLYGTTLEDYLVFEFYHKSHKERKSYVTGRKLHKFFDKVNDKSKTAIFVEKDKFAETFKDYTGREMFLLDLKGSNINSAKKWLRDKRVIFAKPRRGVEGRGVNKLTIDNVEEIIDYCINNKLDLLEEAISQHPHMNKLYPDSVNTIRFITLVKDDEVELLGASLRIGNGSHIDNAAGGGLYASVDIKNGKLDSLAFNSLGEKHIKHPITNHFIKEFEIPFWSEVIEMCKKAALEVPEVRCVGWDVAITEKGPLLIEGNDRWSRFVWQHPKEKGLYHLIKE